MTRRQLLAMLVAFGLAPTAAVARMSGPDAPITEARALASAPVALVARRAGSRLFVVDFAATMGPPLPVSKDLLVEVAAAPLGPYISAAIQSGVLETPSRLGVSFAVTPDGDVQNADPCDAPVWLTRSNRRGDGRI